MVLESSKAQRERDKANQEEIDKARIDTLETNQEMKEAPGWAKTLSNPAQDVMYQIERTPLSPRAKGLAKFESMQIPGFEVQPETISGPHNTEQPGILEQLMQLTPEYYDKMKKEFETESNKSPLMNEQKEDVPVSELASNPLEVQKVLDYQRRYLKDLEEGKISFTNKDPSNTKTLGELAVGFHDKVTIFGEGASKELWFTVINDQGEKERRYVTSKQLSADDGSLKEIEELTAIAEELEKSDELISKASRKTKGWETTVNTNREQILEIRKEIQSIVDSMKDISEPVSDESWTAQWKKNWSDKAVKGEIMRVKKVLKYNEDLMKDLHSGGR